MRSTKSHIPRRQIGEPVHPVKQYVLLLTVVLMTLALPVLLHLVEGRHHFGNLPANINKHLIYQPVSLSFALVFLLVLRLSRKRVFKTYFRRGDTTANILPEPYVGIRPKPGETWNKAGKEWTIVISLVTAVVIYFQLFTVAKPSPATILYVLPFVVILAWINSFVEESITRIGVIVALKGLYSDRMIAVASGILFGSVHYFGNPGGLIGVLVSGFLGWLLAKSTLETKGIFWAWLIHFCQDLIIMTALFSSE